MKHQIHKHNRFVEIRGRGIVSTAMYDHVMQHVYNVIRGKHHESYGSGTVSHKHQEQITGGEIHNRNGRHHKEKVHKGMKALSIKPLKF